MGTSPSINVQDKMRLFGKGTPPGEVQLTTSYYYQSMMMENDLLSKYTEYDRIDDDLIEVASALDIYADNATAGGNNLEKEYMVVLQKPNRNYQSVIDNLDKKTELRDIVWSIARSTLKYGNWFVEVVTKDNKVVRFKELPVKQMRILKDNYGRLLKIVQVTENGKTIPIDIWKIVHFSTNRPYTYGDSILKRLRRVSRQLRLCEDALVIARLTKATQKIIYKVDVTGMTSVEALAYIKKWKTSMSRKKLINPLTGEIVEDFNPLRDEQDVYLPVRQNSPTDVTTLNGDPNISDIADIEFQQNRLFSGLKVPKAYLGFEADTHNRNVISALDVQFARQVRRLQKILEKGLRHIYDIAFILAGYDPESIDYKIVFPTISTIDALTEWQVNQTKLMTAQLLLGMGVSLPDEWILGTLLGLPKSEVDAIVKYTDQITKQQEKEAAEQPQPGQEGGAGTTGQQGLINQPSPEPETTTGMTPEDQQKVDQLFASENPTAMLLQLVKSNARMQSLLENTVDLIEWKMNWVTAQQQIDSLKNQILESDNNINRRKINL
jgi:hypothetical protein